MASSGSCFGFSPARWRDRQLTSFFQSCGLQHVSLQVDHQTTIACWCEKTETEEAIDISRPALVLLHGFATSAVWQWYEQVSPLKRNFRIFIPDLVFFGSSTTTSSERSEIFQAQMIAKTMKKMNVSSYSVVGTSYGGFVAYRLAHLFPSTVEKVVIANSGVCITPKDNQELLERAKMGSVEDLLLPRSPQAFRTLSSLSIHRLPPFLFSFLLQSIIQYFYVEGREAKAELLQGITLGLENADALPSVPQKVLLIWGDHDGIFPPAMAYEIKKHLGEKAELMIISDAAHCVQMEKPKEFNSIVEKFLLNQSP
ncbi:hypothetical protein KP509_06G004100 [Ceratopteris richardii]|uniref:AB hydrolase-1 domain-containing protein n=1 Tax=Ceratopteris richardii TaxID=49495 RepID=A0A8T2UL08_CERRI|nr:hypothetical protein KP509_06G004100 [Ceratopteris richardii]